MFWLVVTMTAQDPPICHVCSTQCSQQDTHQQQHLQHLPCVQASDAVHATSSCSSPSNRVLPKHLSTAAGPTATAAGSAIHPWPRTGWPAVAAQAGPHRTIRATICSCRNGGCYCRLVGAQHMDYSKDAKVWCRLRVLVTCADATSIQIPKRRCAAGCCGSSHMTVGSEGSC